MDGTKSAVKITATQFALANTMREQYEDALGNRDRDKIAEVVTTAHNIAETLYLRSDWRKSDRAEWLSVALGITAEVDE